MLHCASVMSGSFLSGYVVTETLLSRTPARGSLKVAAASIALLLLGSLVYWTNSAGLARFLPASREAVFGRSEYWRLFTSILAHTDFEHFAANALVYFSPSFSTATTGRSSSPCCLSQTVL